MIQSRLTTIDNPYDPFDEFEPWFAFDVEHGYHTPGYLASIVVTSDELSEADQLLATEQGIDEIIRSNDLKIYKKVQREV